MSDDNIFDYEPTEIAVGETLEWTRNLPAFPASEWTLTYYFRGAGPGFDVTATADGDAYSITVPTSSTSNLVEGVYFWQAWVTKDSEKHMVGSDQVKVKKDFTSITTSTIVDKRSQLKKILDAIDAMVLGKATLDQQEYAIGNRQLKRIPIPDLMQLRREYAALYAQEVRAARRKGGASYLKNINARFDTPR